MTEKKKNKNKWKIITAVVLVLVVAAGVLYSVFKPEEKLSVVTVAVQRGDIEETLDTTGTVAPKTSGVFSVVDGVTPTAVNVKVGDIVNAGDPVASFDTAELDKALDEKERIYEQAHSAYVSAMKTSESSKKKTAELQKQIAELERKTEKLKNAEKTEAAESKTKQASAKVSDSGVKISDKLVSRFRNIAKLFGVEYSEEKARAVLENMLSSGTGLSGISSMLDNLNSIADYSGSFDMSAFGDMSASSAVMSAELQLAQLKAQLASEEFKSGDTYISTCKMISDRAYAAYTEALKQVEDMKDGWSAESRGIVSVVNITAGQKGVNGSSEQGQSLDISSILSSAASGSDVSSMLDSLFSSDKTAIKIEYYPLVADISLSKYDVLKVRQDQEVTVKSASGVEFNGKVSYVGAVADTAAGSINLGSLVGSTGATASVPAQVTINDADSSVIIGTDIDVSIVTGTEKNVILVPVEAVCIEGSDIFVYKYDEKTSSAVKEKVEIGISDDKNYSVVSGVSESDVLIKNTTGLEDGVKVKIGK